MKFLTSTTLRILRTRYNLREYFKTLVTRTMTHRRLIRVHTSQGRRPRSVGTQLVYCFWFDASLSPSVKVNTDIFLQHRYFVFFDRRIVPLFTLRVRKAFTWLARYENLLPCRHSTHSWHCDLTLCQARARENAHVFTRPASSVGTIRNTFVETRLVLTFDIDNWSYIFGGTRKRRTRFIMARDVSPA